MRLRSPCAMTDLVCFALLDATALAAAALLRGSLRVWRGDGRESLDPAVVGSVALLTLAALAGAVLIALAHRAALACLLTIGSGLVLMAGGTVPLGLVMPKAFEAAGPAAMVMMFPLLASVAAIPLGLLLRALVALL